MEAMMINDTSYTVIKLLGHGKGGYSYLVTDGEKQFVLKQIHHEPCDYYQFGDKLQSEIQDYDRLKEIGIRMPELYAVDVPGERILKEYIQGPTVAELVKCRKMKQEYILQIREMSRILREAGLNIDYYPTNFVVQDGNLFYIDYECNPFMEQWSFEQWGIQYWE